MRKRILSACMAICMLLTLAPVALAEDASTNTSLPNADTDGVITLTGDIKPAAQLTIDTDNVTLDGQGRTIQAVGQNWSSENADKHLLLITGKNVTIKNVTLDSNDLACGVEVYCATGVKFEDVTITNSKNAGLLVNASEVTVTGTLTMENNEWGGVNVGWGSSLSSASTPTSCSFNAEKATLVGVDSIYTDNDDVTNAGNDGASKFTITLPETGWAETTLEGKNKIYAPSVAKRGDTEYASLKEAIAGTEDDSTITLLKDAKENVTISKDKTVTLDLNGKTLSNASDEEYSYTVMVKPGAVLTVGGEGVIENSAWFAIGVEGGQLIIEDGTVIGADTHTGIDAWGAADVQVKGGTVKAGWAIEASNQAGKEQPTTVSISGGEITGKQAALYLHGNQNAGTDRAASPVVATVSGSAKLSVEEEGGGAIGVFGKGAVLNVTGGEITCPNDFGVISGNGIKNTTDDNGGTEINISGGRIVSTGEGNGIYHPQAGELKITDGEIIGATGVEIRAGNLTVSGGSITGTAKPTAVAPNGNGSTSDGVGVAVAQHTTKLPIGVTISGGTISGYSAFYESDPEGNQPTDVKVAINGGNFKAINGGQVSVYSENCTKFISGGYFTSNPSAYLAAGKALVASDKDDYPYQVGEKTVDVAVQVSAGAPKAEVPEELEASGVTKDTVNAAIQDPATQTQSALTAAVASTGMTNDTSVVGTKAAAEQALGNLAGKDAEITVVVQPYLDVAVQSVTKEEGKPAEMTVEISAKYNVVATTNPADIKTDGNGKNAVVMKEAQDMTVTTPVAIKLPLPDGFVSQTGTPIYIHHVKGNTTYVYKATVTEDNGAYYATFTNPHGFSTFVVKKDAAAFIGAGNNAVYYASLADAVKAVENGQTITLLKAGETATVDRTVNFKVDANGNNYTINLGSYCTNNSTTTNEYNIVYSRPSGGGGGGSGSSNYTLTFDTNGGSSISKLTKSKGSTVDLTQYTPTRTGYTFDGWYTDKDLTEAVTTLKLTSSTTVYAKWTVKTAESTLPFVDVKTGDWFYDSVQYVYDQGMMTGTASNTFSPNSSTTRGMIVTILYRLEKSPTVSAASAFTDVAAGQWYADAVAWAAANDIVNGTSPTTFAPNAAITREQMAAILYRYAQFKGYDITNTEDLSKFSDQASISEYAVAAMSWANAEGLINGVGTNTLSPKGSATRGQVAAILARFCQNVVK